MRDYTLAKIDQQREVTNLQQLNNIQRDKEDQLQRELNDVYQSLRRKEEVLKQMEARLVAKIEERDDLNNDLRSQIQALE